MWQKLDRIMAGIGTVLSVISVGIVVILGILQVLFRFILKVSVPWTEEMMRALFIYIVFFGLILVERENGEVRTTMLIEKLPYKAYHVWESIVSLLSILFNVLVIIGCFQAMKVTNTTLSALPQISMKMFFYPMVISLPLMVIYQIYHMIGHIRKLSGKPGEEAEA
ncbi:MAG: TRAP transporter small permease [Oscillospiraceae bacterium]|nr:TRAP transporter small permease [Oscillospiraceae bacterium]